MRLIANFAAGDIVHGLSTIAKIEDKHGHPGPLTFVAVLHEWLNAAGLALRKIKSSPIATLPVQALPRPYHPLPLAQPHSMSAGSKSIRC